MARKWSQWRKRMAMDWKRILTVDMAEEDADEGEDNGDLEGQRRGKLGLGFSGSSLSDMPPGSANSIGYWSSLLSSPISIRSVLSPCRVE